MFPPCLQARGQKLRVLLQIEKHQHLQDHFVCTGSRAVLSVPLGETPHLEDSPAAPENHPEVKKAALRPALTTLGHDFEFGLSS